jgi:hypothetical protein
VLSDAEFKFCGGRHAPPGPSRAFPGRSAAS